MPGKISIEEACSLLLEKAPVRDVRKVLDYKDLFVFEVFPQIVGLVAVRKDGCGIFGFHPLLNDPDTFFKEWRTKSVDVQTMFE